MVDLKEECSVAAEEQQNMLNNQSRSSTRQAGSEPMKSCTGCYTTTTPLWRGGPAGPKTLCNACGIKYHKKRRALQGLVSGKAEKPKSKKKIRSSSTASRSYRNGSDEVERSPIRVPLKIKMVMKKFNDGGGGGGGGGAAAEFFGRKLGEEEQAAMLLMALSCGSVYA